MAMELLVVPNAWYAQVDEHGRYRIEGIEPGDTSWR
jgi:hypothetical protein